MLLELAVIATGALFGGLVTGATGFAFAIVAGAFWVHVLPPSEFVLLAAGCATLLHAASVWEYRSRIDYPALAPFLLGALIGAPLGVFALKQLDADVFRRLIGVVVVAYAAFVGLSPRVGQVNVPARFSRLVDGIVGWVSGILGGMTMLHGILPTIWCTARGLDKWQSRLIYQPYILFTGLYVMLIVGINVWEEVSRLAIYFLVCLPGLFAGLALGSRLFGRLSEQLFRRLLLVMLLISGIAMLV